MRDEATFEALVRSIFTQRRKTLTNALGRFAEARGTTARDAIARAALDGTRRPETLQLAELARLADVFPLANLTPLCYSCANFPVPDRLSQQSSRQGTPRQRPAAFRRRAHPPG